MILKALSSPVIITVIKDRTKCCLYVTISRHSTAPPLPERTCARILTYKLPTVAPGTLLHSNVVSQSDLQSVAL